MNNNQSRPIFLMVFVCGVLFGAVLMYLARWYFVVPHYMIEEARMSRVALTHTQVPLHPQLREYLKARFYWNAAVWAPRGWLDPGPIDFGLVDELLLGGVPVAKDGSALADLRLAAIKKHSPSVESKAGR
jgi:hypothetical protein